MSKKIYLLVVYAITFSLLGSCLTTSKPSSLVYEPPSSGSILAGRYQGYLRPKNRNEKVFVTLDLIQEKVKSQRQRLKAIVRLDLGQFDGPEFHSIYYPSVEYEPSKKRLVFYHEGQEIELAKVHLRKKVVLKGSMKSGADDIGDFILVYVGKRAKFGELVSRIYVNQKPVQALSGVYQALCHGTQSLLELKAARWPSERTSNTDIAYWRSFKLLARVRQSLENSSADSSWNSAQYDPFAGILALNGAETFQTCKHEQDYFTCGGCRYSLNSGQFKELSTKRKIRSHRLAFEKANKLPEHPDYPGKLAGEFYGYLFNEVRGLYQPVSLKISATMTKEPGMKKATPEVTGVVALYLGGPQSNEYVVYEFDPAFYSSSAPYFIFDGPAPILIQVSQWNEDKIKGLWYSKEHGRIGSVEFLRGSFPPLSSSRLVSKLSGSYVSFRRRLNLLAQSRGVATNEDAYPLTIVGVSSRNAEKFNDYIVNKGMYDFYRGEIILSLKDGGFVWGNLAHDSLSLDWGYFSQQPLDSERIETFFQKDDPFHGASPKQLTELMQIQR